MKDNYFAPVVVFVYKRLQHTVSTLEALNKNLYAENSNLYIYSDGFKGMNDKKEVQAVREYLNEFRFISKFKNTHIIESEVNLGLANSVISGVSKIIQEYGKIIVVEDDLITSVDFLKYMNEALDYYYIEKRIWSIAGYTPNIKGLDKYKKDVYMCVRAGSWGWATWKDRWDSVDWEVNDYSHFSKDKKMRKAFRKCGYDMPAMLDMQMRGQVDSWAIRFCYAQFKQNKVTVNPTISRIKNIGIDGTGTHKVNENRWSVECNQTVCKIEFIPYEINKQLVRAYYNFFAGNGFERAYKSLRGVIHSIRLRMAKKKGEVW